MFQRSTAAKEASRNSSLHVLEERLRSIGVCELHQNGDKNISTMSVRALYNHIVDVIAEICVKDANDSMAAAGEMKKQGSMIKKAGRVAKMLKMQHNIGREQLGTYLQPRDMRELVVPFFSSDEPTMLVRRHVVLMKFDPIRAVVLHDRVLLLHSKVTKDVSAHMADEMAKILGADHLTQQEEAIFGEYDGPPTNSEVLGGTGWDIWDGSKVKEKVGEIGTELAKAKKFVEKHSTSKGVDGEEEEEEEETATEKDELLKSIGQDNSIAFELRAIDAVLHILVDLMKNEVRCVLQRTSKVIDGMVAKKEVRGTHESGTRDHLHHEECFQDLLRVFRDEFDALDARIGSFVRSLSKICDDEKQLALMNLSRLLSNPERFVKPTHEILLEESDEPEMILEVYVQEGYKMKNDLMLIQKKASRAEKEVQMDLDALRNRLLYINTMISVGSLIFAMGSFIGGMFGVNVPFRLNNDPSAFPKIWITTSVLMILCCIIFPRWLYLATVTNVSWSKVIFSKKMLKSSI